MVTRDGQGSSARACLIPPILWRLVLVPALTSRDLTKQCFIDGHTEISFGMIINFRKKKAEKNILGGNLPKFDGIDFCDPKVKHCMDDKKSTSDTVQYNCER